MFVCGPKIKTLALRGLEELFLQLCCCVSFLFWQEIGFGFACVCVFLSSSRGGLHSDAALTARRIHTPYVIRVPYSCGVVLVFFNLAGNSFWYERT
jgi:hypothetical protein